MKRIISLYISVALIIIMSAINAQAIPAYQKPISVKQPDGTTITIRMNGDEYFKYTTTEDGYVIKQGSDKIYYYAEILFDGKIKISDIKANDPARRTAAERAFLSVKTKGAPRGVVFTRTAAKRSSMAMERRITAPQMSNYVLKDPVADKKPKTLVLLVQFQDVKFEGEVEGAEVNSKTIFNRLFNEKGYSDNDADGSVYDYFSDNSKYKDKESGEHKTFFNTEFVIAGPYTISQNAAHYGENDDNGEDKYPREMVKELCKLADKDIDFASFSDKDIVNDIYIIYAGKGEADGGGDNTIWPHHWTYGETHDNVKIKSYACSSELSRFENVYKTTSIGTICHEFGHSLGLNDAYDADYDENGYAVGLQTLSLMANGASNNNGKTPAGLTSYERWSLGWMTTKTMPTNKKINLPLITSDSAYILDANAAKDEFFFFECRNSNNPNFKWDRYIGGGKEVGGMIVYHVDKSDNIVADGLTAKKAWEDNNVNVYRSHECFSALSAVPNGKDRYTSWDQRVDPAIFFFPGRSYTTSLTPYTTPALLSWAGNDILGIHIVDISYDKGVVSLYANNGGIVRNTNINIDRKYHSGEKIDLKVITAYEQAAVSWFVDDKPVTAADITPAVGSHKVKAVITDKSGNKEVVVRYFNVE